MARTGCAKDTNEPIKVCAMCLSKDLPMSINLSMTYIVRYPAVHGFSYSVEFLTLLITPMKILQRNTVKD